MDFDLLLCILLSLISLLLGYTFLWQPESKNIPPTPPFSLPFIGHFHLLKHPVHQTLQKLSQKYGHVFSLRFGSRLVVIVSSPSAVQECFTKNDIVLANRPVLTSGKYLAYNNTTMVVSPYGEHWRNLRRISALEIFSTIRLNSFLGIRENEVKRLLCKLRGDYSRDEFRVVELKPMLLDLTFNIVMRMVAGNKFDHDEGYSKRFRNLVTQIMAHGGSTNLVDFIPLWNWIDPSGFKKRLMKLGKRADEVIQGLIDEIRNNKDEGNTMIDHLLSFQNTQPEYFSDQVIKGLIQAGNKFDHDEGYSKRFRNLVTQIMAHGGSTNLVDFIPLWNWIDPSGFKKRLMKLGKRADEVIQGLIDEIRNNKDEGNTMIDHLLSFQNTQPEYFSDQVIKGLIQDILLAGIDSTALTLEWALSHLLNNPNVLRRARDEIDSSIGHKRMISELDLSSLTYLPKVISEILRLSPAGPLLVPHYASEDCKIQGYDIPRGTIILVNAWAIHRDSKVWENATSFNPQRHGNVSGADSMYKLLPFGLGRRACPGMGMAQRVVGLTLASLIQCFEWKRVGNLLVDMTEGEGLTMPKVEPLVAKCRPRTTMEVMLTEVIGHANTREL